MSESKIGSADIELIRDAHDQIGTVATGEAPLSTLEDVRQQNGEATPSGVVSAINALEGGYGTLAKEHLRAVLEVYGQ